MIVVVADPLSSGAAVAVPFGAAVVVAGGAAVVALGGAAVVAFVVFVAFGAIEGVGRSFSLFVGEYDSDRVEELLTLPVTAPAAAADHTTTANAIHPNSRGFIRTFFIT